MKKLLVIILFAILLVTPMNTEAKTIDMGEFKLTAYCPCYECSEGYGRLTAAQTHARSEHTIAVDTSVISLGTKVKIGDTIYTAEDRGGGVKGDHIDIFFDTHQEVEDFGVRYRQVWIVR